MNPAILAPSAFRSVAHDAAHLRQAASQFAAELRLWFEADFVVYSLESETPLFGAADQSYLDDLAGTHLLRAVVNARRPQLLAEDAQFAVLAVPAAGSAPLVALAAFPLTSAGFEHARGSAVTSAPRAARAGEGASAGEGGHLRGRSLSDRKAWDPSTLLRMAEAVSALLASEQHARRLEDDLDKVSQNLASTYEEISLIHDLTQNLRLSSSDDELAALALDWLLECAAAEQVFVVLLPVDQAADETHPGRREPVVISRGAPIVANDALLQLLSELEIAPGCAPLVRNQGANPESPLGCPGVEQLVVAPLAEGENILGWIGAVNHRAHGEFGTVEASLLNSVGVILGIHTGNCELYRQQAEFLARVVRALTSAIDAKDPYTCGHSDRVARISVRLGQELGLDSARLNTLYMAGLLHDIGKIGIDDNVLKKPGRLTPEEFEHVKQHPEFGYKILAEIKQLADVLPVVLHHHEQWNGDGYPAKLQGNEIPELARIAAVADAYDAMTSDRPYRPGMPLSKVETIFREGAGSQWDARVVEALFAAHDDIRAICDDERANLVLDVRRWT